MACMLIPVRVDELESIFIERLGDAVQIPSISAYADRRKDVFEVRSKKPIHAYKHFKKPLFVKL
ncbi:uncharacterized protein ColSpa_05052 [Colletotrichum spaethianum]|uniref:Uncharacterized protein n=1 Tax=Colletotrichum spaethianum TaxID=700344 RepID=A0AA37P5W9_9PEZI|nr:uncharacterized protein ColSpa_05052 [Colletotrichum spaethianum]GKT44871.1 hypothetical protein ColSpa_05052 [Colletotrichum spaethianum]